MPNKTLIMGNDLPLVSCLTATYGRISHLNECVSCFLAQDYLNKELVILNNHPVPINCKIPNIQIINESGHPNLGNCRNRLIDFINGEYAITWDDDDWWLPFYLNQAMSHIQQYNVLAWKPTYSWFNNAGQFSLASNVFEASIVIKSDLIRKFRYKESAGDEHEPLMKGIHDIIRADIVRPSYVYNWGNGLFHASGKMNHPTETLEQRTKEWMAFHQDVGELKPIDYAIVLNKIKDGVCGVI